MTGYMFVMAPCFSCHEIITFSAERVPSIVIDGVREPICRACIETANPVRVANGLAPIRDHAGRVRARRDAVTQPQTKGNRHE